VSNLIPGENILKIGLPGMRLDSAIILRQRCLHQLLENGVWSISNGLFAFALDIAWFIQMYSACLPFHHSSQLLFSIAFQ
jgi:hypothetical protein